MSTATLPVHDDYTNRLWIASILLLIPLPLFMPYLWLDHLYFWANPDSIFYINIYTSYREALWQGELFPHWLASTNAGLGSLVFYNLASLPYDLTAVISAPFGLPDDGQYLLGIYASQVFGAWVMWRWLRVHYDACTALAGAMLFILVPYKFIDLYQHFSMAHSWAVSCIPLWLHAAERLKTRSGICTYGFAAAFCFYCHPLTVLSVGFLAVFYALQQSSWQWRTIFWPMVYAHLLAGCLIAAYVVPMLVAHPWLHTDSWSSDNYHPLNNLYHVDDFIGLYAPLLMWLVYRARNELMDIIKANSLVFWSGALVVLYILATPISYPLWVNARWMDIFQFPFPRLQPGMGVITALLATALLARRQKNFSIAVASVYALFIILCLIHVMFVYKRPRDLSMLVREIAAQYHIIPGEVHIPSWASVTPNDLLLDHRKYAVLPVAVVKDGTASVSDGSKTDGTIAFHINMQSDTVTAVIPEFYFPAWHATAAGKPAELSAYTDGFIKMQLPKGEYDVHLEVTKSPAERAADALTLATLALYVLHWLHGLKARRS